MALRIINGIHLQKMMQNGLYALIEQEETINRLNVFPVPDGDTGTNMRKTLENGLKTAPSTENTGAFLKGLSEGMLLGARGNSGVILSQFFRGFYTELARDDQIGPGEMRDGLVKAYRTAYQAVLHPVEGTILSVTREGIEHIRGQITRSSSIESILAMYVAEMKKTLTHTPEMLPVLKEAGVVDSGAMGFIVICEGMLQYLSGQVRTAPQSMESASAEAGEDADVPDASLFHEHSAFPDGYCMECILQLMATEPYDQKFRLSRFINDLELYGNSIVAVQSDKRVKVHIHTHHPEKVMALCRTFGEFLTFKLDNMQVQHNRHDREEQKRAQEKRSLAVVATVNGEGLKRVFTELGCAKVIDGGETMNTSAQEFIDVFASLSADQIAVLPNNPNVVMAAKQAASLMGAENVTVLDTSSFAEGYFALAMDVGDSEDTAFRIRQMEAGAKSVTTLSQATASREFDYHGIRCRQGDEILLINHELKCVSDDSAKAVLDGLALLPDMDDKETCVLMRGADMTQEDEDALVEAISERYPLLEVQPVYGGQALYHWIIGLM